jgi:hypothetical protein
MVPDTTPGLHAEMKILAYCGTNSIAVNSRIGISKKCCLRCAVVMSIQNHGTLHRGCGGGLWDAGWTIPKFVWNSVAQFKAFVGNDTHAWYLSLSDDNQRDQFRRLLESLKD